MAKYFITNEAVKDISEIWDYTYDAWSEKQADKYYELLIETCKQISESPYIGKIYCEIEKSILGFRVGKHIIFYREGKRTEIEILRILHERMDLKNKIDK